MGFRRSSRRQRHRERVERVNGVVSIRLPESDSGGDSMSLRDKLPARLRRILDAGRYHVVPSIDGRASKPDLGRTEVQRGAGDLGGSGFPLHKAQLAEKDRELEGAESLREDAERLAEREEQRAERAEKEVRELETEVNRYRGQRDNAFERARDARRERDEGREWRAKQDRDVARMRVERDAANQRSNLERVVEEGDTDA